MDIGTFEALGLYGDNPAASAPQYDAAFLTSMWGGMDLTHVGYIAALPGTVADASGLTGVAATAGPGSDYYFYFSIAKDPAVNSHPGLDMQGDYVAAALWIINFQ